MINSIIYNLKAPHKIPIKIFKKIKFIIDRLNYDLAKYENEQNIKFSNLSLDRSEGLKKLKKIKSQLNLSNREMSSEHEVLFSSISISNNSKISKILEIGTYDGANAYLLSQIFHSAEIETIDLSKSDEDFKNFYNRKNKLDIFVKNRNTLVAKSDKINFTEMNSIELTKIDKQKFDLIWVDGAHGYPVACIDLINSIKLLNDDGIILVDDIILSNADNDRMYFSSAGYDTLNELKKSSVIDFHLIFKRLDANSNCDKSKIKYIAFVKKRKKRL